MFIIEFIITYRLLKYTTYCLLFFFLRRYDNSIIVSLFLALCIYNNIIYIILSTYIFLFSFYFFAYIFKCINNSSIVIFLNSLRCRYFIAELYITYFRNVLYLFFGHVFSLSLLLYFYIPILRTGGNYNMFTSHSL